MRKAPNPSLKSGHSPFRVILSLLLIGSPILLPEEAAPELRETRVQSPEEILLLRARDGIFSGVPVKCAIGWQSRLDCVGQYEGVFGCAVGAIDMGSAMAHHHWRPAPPMVQQRVSDAATASSGPHRHDHPPSERLLLEPVERRRRLRGSSREDSPKTGRAMSQTPPGRIATTARRKTTLAVRQPCSARLAGESR